MDIQGNRQLRARFLQRSRLVLIVANTLQPISVPRAIEKIAATVTPSVEISPAPAAARPSSSKLNAPGTNAQNAASIITIAGGEVFIRAPSIANGTTRHAPTAPEWMAPTSASSAIASMRPARLNCVVGLTIDLVGDGADLDHQRDA